MQLPNATHKNWSHGPWWGWRGGRGAPCAAVDVLKDDGGATACCRAVSEGACRSVVANTRWHRRIVGREDGLFHGKVGSPRRSNDIEYTEHTIHSPTPAPSSPWRRYRGTLGQLRCTGFQTGGAGSFVRTCHHATQHRTHDHTGVNVPCSPPHQTIGMAQLRDHGSLLQELLQPRLQRGVVRVLQTGVRQQTRQLDCRTQR